MFSSSPAKPRGSAGARWTVPHLAGSLAMFNAQLFSYLMATLVVAGPLLSSGQASGPRPTFEVLPMRNADQGQGGSDRGCVTPSFTQSARHLSRRRQADMPITRAGALKHLQQEADSEGFLDRILGTDCFSKSVSQLNGQCKNLQQDQKYRLAFSLLNCHQQHTGGRMYICSADMTISNCASHMSDRDHSSFMEFLTNIDR